MIGSIEFEALGSTQSMRLSNAAGRRLEKRLGLPFAKIAARFGEEFGFEMATAFFAEALADGAGVSDERADTVIDDIGGLQVAGELVGKCLEAAMPPPAEEKAAPKGNAKREG